MILTTLGELISLKKYWSEGSPVAGQHFEYAFDDIGNRQSTKAGGDNSGANLRPASYLNNALASVFDQDYKHLAENRRHYNRDPKANETTADKENADILYVDYVEGERARFNSALHRNRCVEALESLGLLSHSWQDFYAHAIRRDGLGGYENSGFPGWTAFSEGIRGTPEQRDRFWPSSYVGEHPKLAEPVYTNSREGQARQVEAILFVARKYDSMLAKWFAKCKSCCNDGSMRTQ